MSSRDVSAGFRRVLYDAMVLSSSLRVIRDCPYYRKWSAARIEGSVEAHQANALIQIRSMIDFLGCDGSAHQDTMTVVQFFGCKRQSIQFQKRVAHKYVAHKSWDAVGKVAAAGAAQPMKTEIVTIGLQVLDGFYRFSKECDKNSLGIKLNDYGLRYREILDDNYTYLKSKGA